MLESTPDPPSAPPEAFRGNEFRRPRRPVHIKDIVNSKFNSLPEWRLIERTPISEHDEEVYREAERLRILRESGVAEERNRRYRAQRQNQRYDK